MLCFAMPADLSFFRYEICIFWWCERYFGDSLIANTVKAMPEWIPPFSSSKELLVEWFLSQTLYLLCKKKMNFNRSNGCTHSWRFSTCFFFIKKHSNGCTHSWRFSTFYKIFPSRFTSRKRLLHRSHEVCLTNLTASTSRGTTSYWCNVQQ